ncbi:MAG: XdhC family protein [Rhodospirillales bacterium]|nr:XdhC family protein [Rhodospirillales bacterium]
MEQTQANQPLDDMDCLVTALGWIREGRQAALACVTRTWGSAPRPVGSFLAINDQGAFVGSVSGGCIEGEVATQALQLMRRGGFRNLDFAVSDEQASGAGLACGGKVTVHVCGMTPQKAAKLEQVIAAAADKREIALVIDLASGETTVETPDAAPADIATLIHQGKNAIVHEATECPLFVRPFLPRLRLLIVGAVHIAQELAYLAQRTGYAVTLIDPRDTWATAERFPGFFIDRRMPGEAIAEMAPDQRTALVALCHDPKLDDPALVEGLKSKTFYLGALGSRKNHAGRLARLAEYGFDEQTLARINGPIGLDIGAATPAEIAISIVAEMTKTLRQPPPVNVLKAAVNS